MQLLEFNLCLAEAYSEGDCLYDSVMEAILNDKLLPEVENFSRLQRIKWLRQQCSEYANWLKGYDDNWLKGDFITNWDKHFDYDDYLNYVKYSIDDFNNSSNELLKGAPIIWGSRIDAVILSHVLHIKIHICYVNPDGSIVHFLADGKGKLKTNVIKLLIHIV